MPDASQMLSKFAALRAAIAAGGPGYARQLSSEDRTQLAREILWCLHALQDLQAQLAAATDD